jgi:hypothetical protein
LQEGRAKRPLVGRRVVDFGAGLADLFRRLPARDQDRAIGQESGGMENAGNVEGAAGLPIGGGRIVDFGVGRQDGIDAIAASHQYAAVL